MKRFAGLCVLLVLLAGVGGCAKNSADSLLKQEIALKNEMSDVLESDAPESAMAPLKTRQEELKKKIDALSEEEKKKAVEQNKVAFEKANTRFLEAFFKRLDKEGLLDKDKGK